MSKNILFVGGPHHGKITAVPDKESEIISFPDRDCEVHVYTQMNNLGLDDGLPFAIYEHQSLILPNRRMHELRHRIEELDREYTSLTYRFGPPRSEDVY